MGQDGLLLYGAWVVIAMMAHNWFLADWLGGELSGGALAMASFLVLYLIIEK